MSSMVSIFLNSCTWEQQQPRIMPLEKVGYSCYNSKSFSFTFKASWSHGCKLTCKIREINSESNLCSKAHTNFKFRLKNKMLVKNCGRQIWLLKRCLKLQGLCLMGRRWKKERCVKGEHQVINPDERNLLGHVLIFQHVLPHCPPALSFSLKTEVVLPMPLFCMSSEQKWQQKWQRCPQVLFWTSVGIVSWRKLTERLGIEVVLFLCWFASASEVCRQNKSCQNSQHLFHWTFVVMPRIYSSRSVEWGVVLFPTAERINLCLTL